MIISTDTEKAFDKIQHPFMIKVLMKRGAEEMYFSIIKVIIYKHAYSQHTKGGKVEATSSKVRNETRVPTLSTFIQSSLRISS
jgi:hypothetical protein